MYAILEKYAIAEKLADKEKEQIEEYLHATLFKNEPNRKIPRGLTALQAWGEKQAASKNQVGSISELNALT